VYVIEPLLRPFRAGPLAARIDWELLDALAAFGGVRIEDDLVVRHEGPCENLTRAHLA
jgi:Xaa-Pro dipeptidase